MFTIEHSNSNHAQSEMATLNDTNRFHFKAPAHPPMNKTQSLPNCDDLYSD